MRGFFFSTKSNSFSQQQLQDILLQDSKQQRIESSSYILSYTVSKYVKDRIIFFSPWMDAQCHGQNRSSFFSKCFFSLIDPSLYAYVHRLYICQGRCSSLRKLYCHLIILQNLRKSLFRNVCFRYYPPQNIKHTMLWISKNKEFLYKILYKIQPILS